MRKTPILTLLFIFFSLNFCYAQLPTCIWAAEAGGGAGDYGNCVAVDRFGNFFVGGGFRSSFINFDTIVLNNTNSFDGDVFLTKYDSIGNVLWAQRGAGSFGEFITGVVTDSFGNVLISGHFTSPTVTFGQLTLTNSNSSSSDDIFLVKYDSNGNVIWAKKYGGNGDDIANNLAYDNANKICLTGTFDGTSMVFGSDTLYNGGAYDMFVVELDTSGNPIWARSATGVRSENGLDVFIDKSGEVVVAGVFSSTTSTFDTILINNTSIPYNWDIFLAKYNSNGDLSWVKHSGGAAAEWSQGVVVDTNGNIYLTGTFENPSITFDTISINNSGPGSREVFLTKYNATGNALWTKSIAGINNDEVNSIFIDDSGYVYLTGGYLSANLIIDTITLISNGNSDAYIAKFNNSGNVAWAKRIASNGYDEGTAMTIDAKNNLYITGNFWNASLTIDSITLPNHGNGDAFFAKFIQEEIITQIEEPENQNLFSIYPNPSNRKINISTKETQTNYTIDIFNILGKNIFTHYYETPNEVIDCELKSGIYFVVLTIENTRSTIKFIKE